MQEENYKLAATIEKVAKINDGLSLFFPWKDQPINPGTILRIKPQNQVFYFDAPVISSGLLNTTESANFGITVDELLTGLLHVGDTIWIRES